MNHYITLSIYAVLFAFVVYLIVNLKSIRLSAIRSIYGPYSLKYITQFKRIYYLENPYPICIEDDLVSHFSNFASKNSMEEIPFTNKTIDFGSIPFNAKLSVLKRKGKPARFNIYSFSDKFTVRIMGFSEEIMGNTIREHYFFANNIFFMGEYIFSDVSKENTTKIVEMLVSKYDITLPFDRDLFFIRDTNDSVICFENNYFTISIQYINLKNPFVVDVLDAYLKRASLKSILYSDDSKISLFSKL
ncbi:MAG: hypothetical protein WCI92_09105 [Bacteroidota bacterium]